MSVTSFYFFNYCHFNLYVSRYFYSEHQITIWKKNYHSQVYEMMVNYKYMFLLFIKLVLSVFKKYCLFYDSTVIIEKKEL